MGYIEDNLLPIVSVLIVVRNEKEYIKRCIESLINQDYPVSRYEIIVVDGMSIDGTREWLIKEVNRSKKEDRDIKLLDNPKLILSTGWNIGIKNANGDIVIRLDAHSYVEDNFVAKNVEYLQKTDAVCVGGSIRPIGKGYIGNAIASVLSSPFGVGNSKFRYSKRDGYVDTVAYGAYWRRIFNEVGLFNESLVRNQDLDMHSRIQKRGGKFFLTPEIKSYYYSRLSIRSLTKQVFNNGYWNIITLHAISLRHLVPFAFVLSLCLFLGLTIFTKVGKFLLLTIIGAYFLSALFFSFRIGLQKGIRYVPILPIIFFLFHFSYGLGSLWSVIKRQRL